MNLDSGFNQPFKNVKSKCPIIIAPDSKFYEALKRIQVLKRSIAKPRIIAWNLEKWRRGWVGAKGWSRHTSQKHAQSCTCKLPYVPVSMHVWIWQNTVSTVNLQNGTAVNESKWVASVICTRFLLYVYGLQNMAKRRRKLKWEGATPSESL